MPESVLTEISTVSKVIFLSADSLRRLPVVLRSSQSIQCNLPTACATIGAPNPSPGTVTTLDFSNINSDNPVEVLIVFPFTWLPKYPEQSGKA